MKISHIIRVCFITLYCPLFAEILFQLIIKDDCQRYTIHYIDLLYICILNMSSKTNEIRNIKYNNDGWRNLYWHEAEKWVLNGNEKRHMCDNATYTQSYTHAKRFKIRANSEILWCVVVLGCVFKIQQYSLGKS